MLLCCAVGTCSILVKFWLRYFVSFCKHACRFRCDAAHVRVLHSCKCFQLGPRARDSFAIFVVASEQCLLMILPRCWGQGRETAVAPKLVSPKSARMVAFTSAAVDGPDYFSMEAKLDADLQQAIQWVAARPAQEACVLGLSSFLAQLQRCRVQVNAERLSIIAQIEKAGKQMRQSGAADGWFGSSDNKVRRICKGVNGPLLQMLAEACNYHDMAALELLRSGAQLAGDLDFAGNGIRLPSGNCADVDKLIAHRSKTNGSVISGLREDTHSASLHKSCSDDAVLGRMSQPRPLQLDDVLRYTLSPRFGVEQGWSLTPCPHSTDCFLVLGKCLQVLKQMAVSKFVQLTICVNPK